jgi:hypothetical protein
MQLCGFPGVRTGRKWDLGPLQAHLLGPCKRSWCDLGDRYVESSIDAPVGFHEEGSEANYGAEV